MISATFQIVKVNTLSDIPNDFPEHICYYTIDTDKYYIWRNNIKEEIFINLITEEVPKVAHTVKYGVALTIGQAVYVSGADGTNMIVSKASNASEATSSKTLGLIAITGNANFQGKVITEGLLAGTGSDPLNTNSAVAGDPVWLGVNGNLLFGLANKPVAPAHMVFIGIVTRAHATNGEIFVKVQNGFELEELHDVLITNTANKNILNFDSTTGLWKNDTLINVLGYTPVNAINGANNYLAKFTPDGTTLGNSLIQDDGTNVSVNTAPDVLYKFKSQTSNNDYALGGYNTKVGGVGVVGFSNGAGAQTGTVGIANSSLATFNIGVAGTALNGDVAIGIKGFASGSSSVKYGAQLQDGTEGLNKFLKSVTSDGRANWASLVEADITDFGAYAKVGIYNDGYVPRWNATANTLVSGTIQDNGTNLGINTSPDITTKLFVKASASQHGIKGEATSTGNAGLYGVNYTTASTGSNIGVVAEASGNTSTTIALQTTASGSAIVLLGADIISSATATNASIGARITASGNGNKYAVQLIDGSQGTGKFLKSITTDGKANWANITVADVSGAVGGAGTVNYVARWTPNGTMIGNSLIQDNGNEVGLCNTPLTIGKVNAQSSDKDQTLFVRNSKSGGINNAIFALANGTGSNQNNTIIAQARGGSNRNTGVSGISSEASLLNVGVQGEATQATTNVGIQGYAAQGTNNYSAQLQDGTEQTGKFLKSVTNNGHANWANITAADVSGAVAATSGTNNYIAKFTPNGTTIGNSQIQDNGSVISIDETNINAGIKLNLKSNRAVGIGVTQTVQGISFDGRSQVAGTGSNFGIITHASNSTTQNVGIESNATSGTTSVNIAVKGYAAGGASNYAIQLLDGTETSGGGKFLKDTGNGRANWFNITASDVSGVEPTITAGTTSQYWRGDKTWQTLDTTDVAEGTNLYFTNARAISATLTGLSITGGNITSSDSILVALGKLQNQLNTVSSAMIYQGTWDANTNTPTLASGTGTKGFVYRVNVSGSTNIDGITDWKAGDFIVFNGTTWDKWDATDAVTSVNGYTGVITLVKADVGLSNVLNVDTTTTSNISDSVDKRFVTDAQLTVLGNTSGTNTGDQDLSGYATKNLTLDRKTASYTLVSGDNNKLIEMNVATANNVTINNSVFTAGNQILVSQYGAGQVTFVAGSGVTLRSPSGKLKLTGQYSLATIIAISATEFYISGDLTA